MKSMDAILQSQLDQRRAEYLYRTRLNVASGCSSTLNIDGQTLVNFCSNDYLGLAAHPAISQALKQAADQFGTGSGASHLISGHSEIHDQLEQQLAEFTGRPRALLYSTGYMANMGVINALVGRHDLVLQDQLNHASLLDGGHLSRATSQRYKHKDLDNLQQRLEQSTATRKLIVTDGVFSMDGDVAPLKLQVGRRRAFSSTISRGDRQVVIHHALLRWREFSHLHVNRWRSCGTGARLLRPRTTVLYLCAWFPMPYKHFFT